MSHFILLSHLCYCWLVVCENEVINGVINEVIKYCFLHQEKNDECHKKKSLVKFCHFLFQLKGAYNIIVGKMA